MTPYLWGIKACDAQLRGKHLVAISPTGSEKTLPFHMPFLWQKTGVTIIISPLNALSDQQASDSALVKLRIIALSLTALTATDKVFKVRS